MTGACDMCLRRGHLLGVLAPRIAGVLADAAGKGARPAVRGARNGLFALSDQKLIAAVCGSAAAERAHAFVEAFDPKAARAALESASVGALCAHDDRYPSRLEELDDPPTTLFVAGALERFADLAGGPAVAIVGTRHASPYGLDMARELGRELATAGVTVVSGLALGIDAAAHRGALSVPGARAIGVLACGPERAYPKTNAALHRRLWETGVLISELPPGSGVYRWGFPARNRIMAALAELTVVVEAADPSGSLITARFAAQLGRDVAAVPGRANARGSAGSNRLLRDGAHVVLEAGDVLDLIFGVGGYELTSRPAPPILDPPLDRVLEAVEVCDGVPAMGERTRLPPGELRGSLARLESLGLIRRDELGGYVRTAS